MAKPNRICHTCGGDYYYCPSCPDDKRNPQIYVMWCSERCKDIFGLLTDETFKKISTSECKNELIKLGVTLKDTFRGGVQTHVERVLNYTEPIIQNETVIEEVKVTEVADENNIEIENSAPRQVSTNKKKRKNSEVD